MIIQISLLFSLQIHLADKIAIGLIFSVGSISIVFAIVRVVSLGSHEDNGQFNLTWLTLWATIEAGAVIIVGCLPAFGIFIRSKLKPSHTEYTNDYPTEATTSRRNKKSRTESILLRDVDSATSHPRNMEW